MGVISYTLLCVLILFTVVDWGQTLTIAAHPRRWRERNPVLRRLMEMNPVGNLRFITVTVYFILALALMCLVAALFLMSDDPIAHAFGWVLLVTFIVAEFLCVVNNHRLGIDMLDLEGEEDYF